MKNDHRLIWILMGVAVVFAAGAAAWVARAIASESKASSVPADDRAAVLASEADSPGALYSIAVRGNDGEEQDLSRHKGKALLIVNTASRCGLTPQYAGLEELYRRYHDRGFEVLAFPANNFLGQEPGTDEEIREFCSLKYNTTFPLYAKISVKGRDIHPLYRYLTSRPGFEGDIGWNFAKFLIAPDGRVAARFGPRQEPLSAEILSAVESVLPSSAVPPSAAPPLAPDASS